jgi:hypothetical protein
LRQSGLSVDAAGFCHVLSNSSEEHLFRIYAWEYDGFLLDSFTGGVTSARCGGRLRWPSCSKVGLFTR